MAEAVEGSALLIKSLESIAQANSAILKEVQEISQTNSTVHKEIHNLVKDFKSIIPSFKAAAVSKKEAVVKEKPRTSDATLNKSLKSLIDLLSKTLPSAVSKKEAVVDSPVDTPKKSATDVALEEKVVPKFILFDIETKAYNKLKNLFGSVTGKPVPKDITPVKEDKDKKPDYGLLGKLFDSNLLLKGFGKALASGLLPAIAGLGGSLALAIGSWFNQGPWKGTMKLVGEIGTKIFLPKVTAIVSKFFPNLFKSFTNGLKFIGKSAGGLITKLMPTSGVLGKLATKFLGFFKPLLKRLPVIGTIINIGSAISRFINGDIIGGLIDIASAVAVTIPGIGTAVSLGLGFLNAARDLSGEKEKGVGVTGNIASIMLKAVAPWVGKLASKIKFIPILGNIIQLGQGIMRLKQGGTKNIVQGLIDIVGGIAGFVPGIGTVVSWVASGISLIMDFMGGGEEKKKETKPETEKKGVLSRAWDWVKEKIKIVFTSWFGKLGKGWEQIKSGEVFRGIVTWASFVPGFFWLESLYNWVAGPSEVPKEETVKEDVKFDFGKIFTIIKDGIKSKFKSMLNSLKKLSWVPNVIVEKISSFLGFDKKDIENVVPAKNDINAVTNTTTSTTAPGVSTDSTNYAQVSINEPGEVSIIRSNQDTNNFNNQVKDLDEENDTDLYSNVKSVVPDNVGITTEDKNNIVTNNELLVNRLIEAIKGLTPKTASSATSNVNTVSTSDNSSVTMYGNSGTRDVPYVERNKYRQQLLYIRGIL